MIVKAHNSEYNKFWRKDKPDTTRELLGLQVNCLDFDSNYAIAFDPVLVRFINGKFYLLEDIEYVNEIQILAWMDIPYAPTWIDATKGIK